MYDGGLLLDPSAVMTMMRIVAAFALLPLWAWPCPAAAQAAPPQPVNWVMEVEPAASGLKAGDAFEAVITATIDDGWHVYAAEEMPDGPQSLQIALGDASLFLPAGALKAPAAAREMDEAFGEVTASYTANTTFRLPVRVPRSMAAGAHDLQVDVAFQACDGRMCLPTRRTTLKKTLTITR